MKEILEAILGFAPGHTGGGLGYIEAENNDRLLMTFLPTYAHRRALDPSTVLVRGGRGAGKSALFRLATEYSPAQVQELFSQSTGPQAEWVVGFSQRGKFHPEISALTAMARSADSAGLRAFWAAHLLMVVSEHLKRSDLRPAFLAKAFEEGLYADPKFWVEIAVTEAGSIMAHLDRLEGLLQVDLIVAYDHLDRIMVTDAPEIRSRFLQALLELWLSLTNRYAHLHGKIFLREDLFDDAGRFADASKLQGRSVQLEWSVENLYRVVVRHFADAGPSVVAWLHNIPSLCLDDRQSFGIMPGPMPDHVQEAFATALAGRYMGATAQKGFTHRWIPNHLQDALNRVVPRSMLNLFAEAARSALITYSDDRSTLLKPSHLVAAIIPTSKHRATELAEESPIVNRLENLRGEVLLLDRLRAVELLSRSYSKDDEAYGAHGEEVLKELLRIGVMGTRSDGRLDVPDLYRHHFGIKRKGGAARAR